MTIEWSDAATCQLMAVRDYLGKSSPRYARRLVGKILDSVVILDRMPYFGAEVPEYGSPQIREIFYDPYRIIYRVRPDKVQIVSVIHARRQLPKDPP